ncbi:hypothetical protein ABZ896_38415, partial [Streptomyces sp. NPDC047072]
MRTPWIVGVLLTGALLLGACTDPSDGPEAAPPTPDVPHASTTHQRAQASPDASAPAVTAPRVLYLGDSLAMEAQNVLPPGRRWRTNCGGSGGGCSTGRLTGAGRG